MSFTYHCVYEYGNGMSELEQNMVSQLRRLMSDEYAHYRSTMVSPIKRQRIVMQGGIDPMLLGTVFVNNAKEKSN